MTHSFSTSSPRAHAADRRAFTLVEVITVVVIIGVLAGILLVSFGGVLRTSKNLQCERTLRTIGDAVQAFNTDFRYDPPLLRIQRADWDIGEETQAGDRVVVPEAWPTGPAGDPPTAGRTRLNLEQTRYASEYSIAAYLMGAGDIDGKTVNSTGTAGNSSTPNRGANQIEDDGNAGPGIRDPGPDHSWGGAGDRDVQTDGVNQRRAIRTGRVYGPYLDQSAMASLMLLDENTGLYRVADPWGQPIRYYRSWPTKNRPVGGQPEPSVDFTPAELRSVQALEHQIAASNQPNFEYEREILTARFMLVSAGQRSITATTTGELRPVPLFGDRLRGMPGASIVNPADLGGMVQDLSLEFDPTSLSESDRANFLADLSDNVRFVP